MDDTTILSSALGQLGQTIKQTAKRVIKLPEEMAKDLGGQVGGVKNPPAGGEKPAENKPQQQWQSDEERVKFLRDLYGKSDMPQDGNLKVNQQTTSPDKKPTEFERQIADKSPEERKKLLELRQQLHRQNYYDPTFNPKNSPAGTEERPAEKVANEKKEEMAELQKKEEKKPPPLAVQRASQRVENLPGAG